MTTIPHIPFSDITLGKELGKGGYATVFKGIYAEEEVAVKRIDIHETEQDDQSLVKKFEEFSHEVSLMRYVIHDMECLAWVICVY